MRAPIGGLPNGRATRTRSPAAFRPSPGKDRSKARRPTGRRESRRRSEEHTSELQSQSNLVCRLLLAKKTKPPCMCLSRHPGARGDIELHIRRLVSVVVCPCSRQRFREIHQIVAIGGERLFLRGAIGT